MAYSRKKNPYSWLVISASISQLPSDMNDWPTSSQHTLLYFVATLCPFTDSQSHQTLCGACVLTEIWRGPAKSHRALCGAFSKKFPVRRILCLPTASCGVLLPVMQVTSFFNTKSGLQPPEASFSPASSYQSHLLNTTHQLSQRRSHDRCTISPLHLQVHTADHLEPAHGQAQGSTLQSNGILTLLTGKV